MSTGLPSASVTRPPSRAQSAWSQPEEKCQRPLTVNPPSVGTTVLVGAYEEQIRAVRS
ncbi:hypothetical protein [Streptomyces sp. G-G2]|uniref:hypothetical protein n=1 Tax=Streptomyces sp. G-G2 TaxID=3046201 RepID=UPI0024B98AB0|nr:hypothetical protein [Streptomyces sp. G-G2]MDJ0384322.1 hypothetical protein [Streptomyces sp. G-G2]